LVGGSAGGRLNDPRRALELLEKRESVPVGDPRVDRSRADALVTQVVLDELEGHAGVQEVGGDRVPKPMAGVAAIEAGQIAVAGEQRLDLALAERSRAAPEDWIFGLELCAFEESGQEGCGR
jgi:hypothetical protein